MARVLVFVQLLPVAAYALAAVLQFHQGQRNLAYINVCFCMANYLIFFGGAK